MLDAYFIPYSQMTSGSIKILNNLRKKHKKTGKKYVIYFNKLGLEKPF